MGFSRPTRSHRFLFSDKKLGKKNRSKVEGFYDKQFLSTKAPIWAIKETAHPRELGQISYRIISGKVYKSFLNFSLLGVSVFRREETLQCLRVTQVLLPDRLNRGKGGGGGEAKQIEQAVRKKNFFFFLARNGKR